MPDAISEEMVWEYVNEKFPSVKDELTRVHLATAYMDGRTHGVDLANETFKSLGIDISENREGKC